MSPKHVSKSEAQMSQLFTCPERTILFLKEVSGERIHLQQHVSICAALSLYLLRKTIKLILSYLWVLLPLDRE